MTIQSVGQASPSLAARAKKRLLPRPQIGLTGSFGRGNYGDELYIKTYQHWFESWADLHLLSGLPRPDYLQSFGATRVDVVDAICLGGGDLLCPYRSKIDLDFIHPFYLRRPLHIAGIGVETNKPDIFPDVLERWQEFLRHDNVKSITLRDPGSQAWVKEHIAPQIEVGVTPDLVCAMPLPATKRADGPPVVGLVTRHIKHPKEYKLMAEIASNLHAQGWRVLHIIGGVGPHGRKDFENSKTLVADGKETLHCEDLDEISRALGSCSLVLSMKLHTTIVATMYGVPTICMNPSYKARQFMKAVGRERYVFAHNDRAVFDVIKEGVPDVPQEPIHKLRDEASAYMRKLGQHIWDDYRARNLRRLYLRTQPQWPQWPAE